MIVELKSEKELKKFVKFDWEIYKNDTNWVPPLIKDRIHILSFSKNPFFKHADGKYFFCYRDGKLVGKIAAYVHQMFNEYHNEKTAYFGFYESINDVEVAKELTDAACTWAKEQGMNKIIGPMNPSTNEEVGFLLENFEQPPFIMLTYTKKYYLDLFEQCGFTKEKDLFCFLIDPIPQQSPEKLSRIAKLVRKRDADITVRHLNIKDFKNELKLVKLIYNDAWSKNWGFVPMTDDELELMAKNLKPLVVPELIIFAFVDKKPVAFLMVIPDYNEVLIKLNGKLGPVQIIKFLFLKKKIKGLRLITLGIREGFRKRGIDALMFEYGLKQARKIGYSRTEFSWVLEENVLIHRAAEMINGKLYKKYRIYGKDL